MSLAPPAAPSGAGIFDGLDVAPDQAPVAAGPAVAAPEVALPAAEVDDFASFAAAPPSVAAPAPTAPGVAVMAKADFASFAAAPDPALQSTAVDSHAPNGFTASATPQSDIDADTEDDFGGFAEASAAAAAAVSEKELHAAPPRMSSVAPLDLGLFGADDAPLENATVSISPPPVEVRPVKPAANCEAAIATEGANVNGDGDCNGARDVAFADHATPAARSGDGAVMVDSSSAEISRATALGFGEAFATLSGDKAPASPPADGCADDTDTRDDFADFAAAEAPTHAIAEAAPSAPRLPPDVASGAPLDLSLFGEADDAPLQNASVSIAPSQVEPPVEAEAAVPPHEAATDTLDADDGDWSGDFSSAPPPEVMPLAVPAAAPVPPVDGSAAAVDPDDDFADFAASKAPVQAIAESAPFDLSLFGEADDAPLQNAAVSIMPPQVEPPAEAEAAVPPHEAAADTAELAADEQAGPHAAEANAADTEWAANFSSAPAPEAMPSAVPVALPSVAVAAPVAQSTSLDDIFGELGSPGWSAKGDSDGGSGVLGAADADFFFGGTPACALAPALPTDSSSPGGNMLDMFAGMSMATPPAETANVADPSLSESCAVVLETAAAEAEASAVAWRAAGESGLRGELLAHRDGERWLQGLARASLAVGAAAAMAAAQPQCVASARCVAAHARWEVALREGVSDGSPLGSVLANDLRCGTWCAETPAVAAALADAARAASGGGAQHSIACCTVTGIALSDALRKALPAEAVDSGCLVPAERLRAKGTKCV